MRGIQIAQCPSHAATVSRSGGILEPPLAIPSALAMLGGGGSRHDRLFRLCGGGGRASWQSGGRPPRTRATPDRSIRPAAVGFQQGSSMTERELNTHAKIDRPHLTPRQADCEAQAILGPLAALRRVATLGTVVERPPLEVLTGQRPRVAHN
jgi:hypothetical protein